MTKGDDIRLVNCRYTSRNDLIGTILEQIRIVPKKSFHLGQKFELILLPLMQKHLAGNKIVHYVSKPRCRIVSNVHQLLIRKGPRNGGGVLGKRKKSELDRFLRKILEFGGRTDVFEFFNMRVRVFVI
jgi:hypothetical protein